MTSSVRARQPVGERASTPTVLSDREALDGRLEDAAHFPGGHALGIAYPRTEADVAALLKHHRAVLPVAAQSSLTGGATPRGELLVSLSRLTGVGDVTGGTVRVGAGTPLTTLVERLARQGLSYPPVPTFLGASAGGVVSTNAAGAATFKHGTTRRWVEGLTVVLASGEVLDLVRGQCHASPAGHFDIETCGRTIRVPVPTYRMPDVPKISAGYFAAPGMDLVDLFVGSEGTLGVITEVVFRVIPRPASTCLALIPVPAEAEGLRLVGELRAASTETWRTGDPAGIDVAAIEHLDRRCLEILREDGADRRCGVSIPPGTEMLLLVQVEVRGPLTGDDAYAVIASALDADAIDSPLARLCRLFARYDLLDRVEIALADDVRRRDELLALREAAPLGVNQRVGLAKRTVDPLIEKTAADMIVPFDRFGEMMAIYRAGYERRGLDYAIWGHVSDGNVHPNVIPRALADVRAGQEAILEFGREVTRLGGCPLAEHGVGRSPVKQALLRQLYGDRGVDEMRGVKRALDPEWKLAPGVLFPHL